MKKHQIALLSTIISFLFPFVCGILTMHSNIVLDNSMTNALAGECHDSDYAKVYLQHSINDKETGDSREMSFFSSFWSQNFGGLTQLVAAAEGNELMRYSISFDDVILSDNSALTTVQTYSNSNKRFERICFELLKDRPRAEELSEPSGWTHCRGKIWLPDYYGDKIIEENPSYTSYDDIINAEVPCKLRMQNEDYGIYKIANFFHVRGFTEKYTLEDEKYRESDYYFGTMFANYIGDFALTSDNKLAETPSFAMVAMLNAKRFTISDYLTNVSAFYKDNDVTIKYAKVVESETISLDKYGSLIAYHCENESAVTIVIFVLFVILFIGYFVFGYWLVKNHLYEELSFKLLVCLESALLALSLIIQFARVKLLSTSVVFMSIFSSFFGVALLIVVIFLAGLVVIRYGDKKKSVE